MGSLAKCKYCEPNLDSFHILKSYLPEEYEYMVCSFSMTGSNFKTRLRTDGKNQEFAQKWLDDFQMHSKCTMRVERTYPHSGTKNVFKIDLRCQHNTRPRSEKVREKDSCKNTDCPAKMGITIKRVVTERKSRSKDPHLPNYPSVLQLDFCHNHPILTPEILRHRSVLPEIKGKILNLFNYGHNPATALDMHKYDLQLEHGENYSKICQDRAIMPDPQFCYRLYYKIIRRQGSGTNGESFSPKKLSSVDSDGDIKSVDSVHNNEKSENSESCNESTESTEKKVKKKRKLDNSVIDRSKLTRQLEDVLCKFCENGGFAGMQLIDGDIVMALVTPLMHRVHTMVKQSGELIFVDAYGELDEPNNCRVLMFVTNNCAGALPLGCLITTSPSAMCIKAALDLWKQILPDGCFYGKNDGPQIFLTNDDDAEKQALKEAFPQSHFLVCISHVLQTSWNFLWGRKNIIKKDHRTILFSKVKMLLFSHTMDELEINYNYSIQDNLVKTYPVFVEHYNYIYNHRHEWSLAYRRHLLPRGQNVTMYWEVAMIILKDPILCRTRTYNQLQVIDFLSRLDTYYERRLIDMANGRFESVKNSRFLFIEMPREAYTITQKSESEYEVHNDTKDTMYQVDIALGMCECRIGKNGAPCKHQLLVLRNFSVPSYDCIHPNAQVEKMLLFQLATGQEVENGSVEITNNVHGFLHNLCQEMSIPELTPCSDSEFFLSDNGPCDSLNQNSTIEQSPVLNSHVTTVNLHNAVIPQHDASMNHHHHHLMLGQDETAMPPQQTVLGHHSQSMNHRSDNLSHLHLPPSSHNILPLNQHTPPPLVPPPHHQPALSSQCLPPPPPPPPPPPLPPEIQQIQNPQNHAVHDLINQVCKKLKERTSRMPQTFIPALDTFLKNFDKLSSDSSLEYALYSFGKFSKSAMPLFKRKVINNKLIGLQSTGDIKKSHQALKSSKLNNDDPHR